MTLEHMLAKLVSFRSVTGERAEVEALFEWLVHELQPTPLYVRTYEHRGLPSLVITPTRKKHAKLWLAAHVDVVPAPDALFSARRDGDRLVGRGVFDMKFAVACYVHLLKELGAQVREYDIGIMLTPDEERAGDTAVGHILEKEGYTGDVAFLPDGCGVWQFEESAKGLWGVEVVTQGVAAHGSKPWLGRSAITELMAFLTEAQGLVDQHFTPPDTRERWYTTMNIGSIAGGEAFNMVAAGARATVDIRYIRMQDRKVLERVFRTLAKKYSHTSWQVLHDEPPYGILRTNGYAKTFARIAQEMHQVDVGWTRAHGASDARFFNRAGIPTILIGPSGGDAHSDTEWVDIHDLERYYDVLKQFVEEVARRT